MYHNRYYQPARRCTEAGQLQKNFKKIKFLGQGSFGKVYQVERRSDGQVYALKELDVRSMKQSERNDAANEARFLASVQHVNVLSYKEAFIDGAKLYIVMEYAPYGDLHKFLRERELRRQPLTEKQIWRFFIQALQGVAALHDLGVLHRDIKPLNIMVTDSDVVKVGDLGIARRLVGASGEKMARTQIGTPHYMAPEIWRGQAYGLSTDMWALGCLLYQLATLKVPFDARDISTLKSKIMRTQYTPLPSSCPSQVAQVIRQLLVQSPSARPTAQQLLSSSIIQSHLSTLPKCVRDAPAAGGELLATIKVPINLANLQSKLPPANYCSGSSSGEAVGGRQRLSDVAEEAEEKVSMDIEKAKSEARKKLSQVQQQDGRQPSPGAEGKGKEVYQASPSAFDRKVKEALEKQKQMGAEAKIVVGSRAHRVPARDALPSEAAEIHKAPPPFAVGRSPSPAPRQRQEGALVNRLHPSPRTPSPNNVPLKASPRPPPSPAARDELPYLSPALQRLRQRLEEQDKAGSPAPAVAKTPVRKAAKSPQREAVKKPSAAEKAARKPGQDPVQLYKIYGGAGKDRLGGRKPGGAAVDESSPAAIYMRYKKQVQQANWQYNVRPSWM